MIKHIIETLKALHEQDTNTRRLICGEGQQSREVDARLDVQDSLCQTARIIEKRMEMDSKMRAWQV